MNEQINKLTDKWRNKMNKLKTVWDVVKGNK